jgi:3-hydroxybutyryl-CoA dehydratase
MTAGLTIEQIDVGMEAQFSKTITEADIVSFAEVTGDTNPVHLDQAYAEGTMFKERIAHGMLSASMLSTVFGTKLPGPGCVYLSQTLKFKAPVRIGQTVVATVVAREVMAARKRVVFDCAVKVGDTVVVEGEAVIMVPAA